MAGLEEHWPKQLDPSIVARTAEEIADRTIILGDDVARFINGEVGKYLIARAREELSKALTDLAGETDPVKIRELQYKVQLARAIPEWLQDAIESGRAELELKLQQGEI